MSPMRLLLEDFVLINRFWLFLLPLSPTDVPNAFPLLEDFASICIAKGVFSEDLLAEMPERGRKRFVSEGDGGLIKDNRFVITEPVLAWTSRVSGSSSRITSLAWKWIYAKFLCTRLEINACIRIILFPALPRKQYTSNNKSNVSNASLRYALYMYMGLNVKISPILETLSSSNVSQMTPSLLFECAPLYFLRKTPFT